MLVQILVEGLCATSYVGNRFCNSKMNGTNLLTYLVFQIVQFFSIARCNLLNYSLCESNVNGLKMNENIKRSFILVTSSLSIAIATSLSI